MGREPRWLCSCLLVSPGIAAGVDLQAVHQFLFPFALLKLWQEDAEHFVVLNRLRLRPLVDRYVPVQERIFWVFKTPLCVELAQEERLEESLVERIALVRNVAGSQHKMDDAVSLDADHGESRVPFVGKLPPDKTHETDQQPSPWRTQWPILQRHCEVRVKRNKAP